MKFIWQQILGILLVLVIAFSLSGTLLENFLTKQIELTRQEQLIHFGENIVNNNFSRSDLVKASQLLASENIVIQVYLPDGRIIYPTYNEAYNANLSQSDLELLQNDETVGFRVVERLDEAGQAELYLSVYLPHRNVGEFPRGFISLGAPLDGLTGQVNAMRHRIVMIFVLAGLVGIGIAVLYAYYQTNKIKTLQQATQKITQGHYDVELYTDGYDEFSDLARDFKRMAQSLQESEEEIERQEEIRRQFMMDVAHEMRTPLTTMSGLMEGLLYDMIPENRRQRSMELIRDETDRLTRLVNENLDYERIRSRQFSLEQSEIQAADFLQSIVSQMQLKVAEKPLQLVYETADDVIIYADHDRLQQILINLTANAIQFSTEGTITLRAWKVSDGVKLSVSDEGIGIDTDALEHIWDRFYKADISRTSTKFGESGIGLAVVHSLVQAHHGTITVESELGQGTTFEIWLPNKEELILKQ